MFKLGCYYFFIMKNVQKPKIFIHLVCSMMYLSCPVAKIWTTKQNVKKHYVHRHHIYTYCSTPILLSTDNFSYLQQNESQYSSQFQLYKTCKERLHSSRWPTFLDTKHLNHPSHKRFLYVHKSLQLYINKTIQVSFLFILPFSVGNILSMYITVLLV